MITLSMYLYLELFAAAALALWVVARFPTLGPKSLLGAGGLAVLAFAVGDLVPFAIVAVVTSTPAGIYGALFGCVLPALFAMLLTTAWLLRALLSLLRGAGGGGGHRVPAR